MFDYDTAALTAVAVAMRDKGELPTGKKVGGKADFFIGAADVPIDPPAGWEPKSLKAKIAAGGEFAQTQFCMDAGVVRRYLARLAEHGVTTPFLIGISPLRSAKSARWMQGEAVRHHHSRTRPSRGWKRRPIRPPRAARSASI